MSNIVIFISVSLLKSFFSKPTQYFPYASQGKLIEERGCENAFRRLPVNASPDQIAERVRAQPTCLDHSEKILVLVHLPMGMEDQENDGSSSS